jgi:hypothetical protein
MEHMTSPQARWVPPAPEEPVATLTSLPTK